MGRLLMRRPIAVTLLLLILAGAACAPPFTSQPRESVIRSVSDPFTGVTTHRQQVSLPTPPGRSITFSVSVSDTYRHLCLGVTYTGNTWLFAEGFRFLVDGEVLSYRSRSSRSVAGGRVIEVMTTCFSGNNVFRQILEAESVLLGIQGRSNINVRFDYELRQRFNEFYLMYASRMP